METILWLALLIMLAVVVDLIVVNVWRRYNQIRQETDTTPARLSRWQLIKQAILLEAQDGILRKPIGATIGNENFKQGAKILNQIADKMTPAQIQEAKRLAMEWEPGRSAGDNDH